MPETLEVVVGRLLAQRGLTVGTAESCTGGLIGHRLTDVPGSSEYFLGGIIAYSNEIKERVLGVNHATLETHGAVSAETALEMAYGAPANVAFGELTHFNRRLDARHDTGSLQGVLKGQRVQDGGEHAHVIGLGAFHPGGAGCDATENVASTDDDGDFSIKRRDGGDFRSEAFEDGRLDAVSLLTGQHLSAHFQDDAPVFGRVHASPSW